MAKYEFPVEKIDLPSKGLLYPKSSPLSRGFIEMKYLSAKEEDILTNRSYMRDNTVLDKLFESLIVTENVTLGEMLQGDIDAIFFACRILSYGPEYEYRAINPWTNKEDIAIVDLNQVELKFIDEEKIVDGVNEFEFELPFSKKQIKFKLLTKNDTDIIKKEAESWKKTYPDQSYDKALKLIYTITAIDGKRDDRTKREFVNSEMTARDAKSLRAYITEISPSVIPTVDVKYKSNKATEEGVELQITKSFYWPDLL